MIKYIIAYPILLFLDVVIWLFDGGLLRKRCWKQLREESNKPFKRSVT